MRSSAGRYGGVRIANPLRKRHGRTAHDCWSFLFLTAGHLLTAGLAQAQQGPAGGIQWLREQQGVDGSWAGEARLAFRDTAEAVEAFELLAPEDGAITGAVDMLAGTTSPSLDLEARRLGVLGERLPRAIVNASLLELKAAQAPDGGWGSHRRYSRSSALESGLAARALALPGALLPDEAFALLGRLEELQDTSGGFASAEGGDADLITTAEVVRGLVALSAITNVEPVLCQNSIDEKACELRGMRDKTRRDFDRKRGVCGTARRLGSG